GLHPAARVRPRRRHPPRRHRRPLDPRPVGDGAPRRPQLVPARLAALAAGPARRGLAGARRAVGRGAGPGCRQVL
ncbi:MAG: hypothetical protein AVDCRST_MAG59-2093, partial [uncultured Thermomicrobiales bacterium]